MFELTEELQKALLHCRAPLRLLNPLTKEAFVLLRAEEYDQQQPSAVADNPWTDEEMDAMA